jgi:chromosome segregation ATPase
MSELQNKLTEAEAAASAATKEFEALKAEHARVNETLDGRGERDFDKLADLARRRAQLPELIFTATVNARKSNIALLYIRREIAQAAHNEACRQVEERRQPLETAITDAERKALELKNELAQLLGGRDQIDREAANYMTQLHDAEEGLRDYIRKASFEPESSAPKGANVVRMRPTEIAA